MTTLIKALEQIKHSLKQALVPGNDKLREIRLSLNLAEQALSCKEELQPVDLELKEGRVSVNGGFIISESMDIALVVIDLRSKRCDLLVVGESEHGVPVLTYVPTKQATNLKESEQYYTEVSLPQFKHWDVFQAHHGKYTTKLTLTRRKEPVKEAEESETLVDSIFVLKRAFADGMDLTLIRVVESNEFSVHYVSVEDTVQGIMPLSVLKARYDKVGFGLKPGAWFRNDKTQVVVQAGFISSANVFVDTNGVVESMTILDFLETHTFIMLTPSS